MSTKATEVANLKKSPDIAHLVEGLRRHYGLSPREIQVVAAATSGLHTKGTAVALGCSAKTVDELWRRICRKTRLNSRLKVVALVLSTALE